MSLHPTQSDSSGNEPISDAVSESQGKIVSSPYVRPAGSPVAGLISVQPRVLTVVGVLVACFISYCASSIFAYVLAIASFMLTHGNVERTPEMLEKVWTSRIGFPLLVLVPQVGLALPVVFAAALGRSDFVEG